MANAIISTAITMNKGGLNYASQLIHYRERFAFLDWFKVNLRDSHLLLGGFVE